MLCHNPTSQEEPVIMLFHDLHVVLPTSSLQDDFLVQLGCFEPEANICQSSQHGAGQGSRIVNREEQSVPSTHDPFAIRRNVGSDRKRPAGHCFIQRYVVSITRRRRHEDSGALQQPGDLGRRQLTDELGFVCDFQFQREAFEGGAALTVPCDDETHRLGF